MFELSQPTGPPYTLLKLTILMDVVKVKRYNKGSNHYLKKKLVVITTTFIIFKVLWQIILVR